jgi:hypothetical protein
MFEKSRRNNLSNTLNCRHEGYPYSWVLIIIFILLPNVIRAQYFDWELTLYGFADNREYKSEVQVPQTFFGTQFSPELGLQFDSLHTIRVGVNALSEFGSNKFTDKVYPLLYYRFIGDKYKFLFGSFSRHNVLANAPQAIFYDSVYYFRPNINGIYWKYYSYFFSQSVYLDWTSRQTEKRRETFIIGGHGKYHLGNLFVYNHMYMYHYAKTADPLPNEFIRDNGVLYLNVGYDAGSITTFDSLSISIGGIQSYERSRNDMVWHTPYGLIIEAIAEYKGFGIRNILYNGQGHHLDWGDPFYRLKRYNRLDFYFTPIYFPRVKGRFGISMHFAEGKISHQQQFLLNINLNSTGPNKN